MVWYGMIRYGTLLCNRLPSPTNAPSITNVSLPSTRTIQGLPERPDIQVATFLEQRYLREPWKPSKYLRHLFQTSTLRPIGDCFCALHHIQQIRVCVKSANWR